MAPKIQAYGARNDPYLPNLYREYEEPEQDLKPSPNMEDDQYLEEP